MVNSLATKASGKAGTRRQSEKNAARRGSPRAETRGLESKKQEIAGVCYLAVGVLLGIYLFVSASGVLGVAISRVLFGLCGFVAYLIPVFLILFGVLTIRGSRAERFRGSFWFLLLGILSVVALAQVIYGAKYQGVRYMQFIADAYQAGSISRVGGGFVGAVLCYPLQQLGGDTLAYVLLIAVILVVVISVTRLSIRATAERVEERVSRAREEHREHKLDERAEDRRLYGADIRGKADRLATRIAEAVAADEPPFDAPKKKKPAPKVSEAGGELNVMPRGGQLSKKGAAPVLSDNWDDLEPEDDVPLIIKPVTKATPKKKEAPIPSTDALFGAREDSPKPKKAAARVTELLPNAPAAEGGYAAPSFSLLNAPALNYSRSTESPNERARLLEETLESFGISAKVINISVGPVLTRFELTPAPGVRVSRITSLSNDIALNLAAPRVRIEAPIPGKAAVGIEVPNKDAVTVVLRDIVESREFQTASSPVTLAFGKDISGKVITADLAKMPHLLIAGSTGSGKSVCINDLIISMVYKSSPADLRFILVDPKMVELNQYGSLPHLLIPVVTEPKKASGALRWAVNEMVQRYKKFADAGARDLARFNELAKTPEAKLPKLVIIIDELADLMMVAPDEVEDSICRIAQLGRAAGIHLIVATQRPSADIITGLIKANIPSRCAFQVSSAIDSRIILDSSGAEKLLGRGDMLFHPNGANKPVRLQCAFVSDEEVERVVEYFRVQERAPLFDEGIVSEVAAAAKGGVSGGAFGEGKQEDELFIEAARMAVLDKQNQTSISMVQRKLRVGYTRACRLVDMLEAEGFVAAGEGPKPRRVLLTRAGFEEYFGMSADDPSLPGGEA